MSKQDYLDKFSDKPGYSFGSGSEFAVSVLNPAAGLGIHAVRAAMQADELAGLVDENFFSNKRDKAVYSNAAAFTKGLFWVGLKKNKKLSSNSLYVSDAAQQLLQEHIAPFSSKVQIDVSDAAMISDTPDPNNFFVVPNAVSLSEDQKSGLLSVDEKLLQPEIAHKQITVYTDQRIATCFVKESLALVGLDDLIAFAGKKNKIVVNYGKGTVPYAGSALELFKSNYDRFLRMKDAAAAKLIPAEDEWKCSSCGRINKNYTGTCGCGESKPR